MYIKGHGCSMTDWVLDNSQLESAMEEFAQDRQKDKYAKVMEILEKSSVLVPAMLPQGLDGEAQKLMREGQMVELPREAKINPCLLTKDTGEQVLPIFTSVAHIPQDKRSTAVLAMPFHTCLSMVVENEGDVETMVLNPFTHNMVLPKEILEVAVKRKNIMGQSKQIKVTEKQFRQLVHNRMALHLLPQYLFENGEEGLKRLQREEGNFLLQFYRESYPENMRLSKAAVPGNFSVMTMNVTENMQITRVDMPNNTNKKGMCYRVYTVWLHKTRELFYYTMENTEQGYYIGKVTSDGKHELVEPVPDNGAEIEAVMNLAARMCLPSHPVEEE